MADHYANPVPHQRPQTPHYLPTQSRQSPISHPIPQQFPPPPPVRPPKQRARIVLLVACVVAFAAAAVFASLYIRADGDHDAAVARLDERTTRLADVREQLAAAEGGKTDAEERNADLTEEHTTLKACVDAVQHYLWDGLEGAAEDAALDAMFTSCQ